MNYLSLFSGIEAASVAFKSLGWQAVGFSEIEPFACSVLARHYPNVTNFGDVTKSKDWETNDTIDLICGGSPCRSFSHAGSRDGLDSRDGQLTLAYVDAVERFKPRWILWENVSGVFTTNGGRDFAEFIFRLEKCGYSLAYRVLDAQYFGVPQRRRRVFVVGYLGDWRCAAAVLFDKGSLRGDVSASEAARVKAAERVARGVGVNCKPAKTLTTKVRNNAVDEDFVISPVDSRVAYAVQGSVIGREHHNGPQGSGHNADISFTLTVADRHAVTSRGIVRRFTPLECARLQGFPDDYLDILHKGKPASDAAKYKALGNSWAVPVARWIGERIDFVEKEREKK